jgi:hypothetical protein
LSKRIRRLVSSLLVRRRSFDIYKSVARKALFLRRIVYLKIWFFRAAVIQRKSVAATGERIEYYGSYLCRHAEAKSFLLQIRTQHYDLAALMRLVRDEDIILSKPTNLRPKNWTPEEKAFRIEQTRDGDTL